LDIYFCPFFKSPYKSLQGPSLKNLVVTIML
jgi:hypothetical protein